MMALFGHPRTSLRVKLVLSHLVVALGAILLLTIAIAFGVQSYFTSAQLETLHYIARMNAQTLAALRQGSDWPTRNRFLFSAPTLLIISDTTGHKECDPFGISAALAAAACNDKTVDQALAPALQGQEVDGRLSITAPNEQLSSLYVATPIKSGDQIIGALLQTEPRFSDPNLVRSINLTILIVGLIVALLVILFSAIVTNHLTRPLRSLTLAVEKMKEGKYTERAPLPSTQDELGKLAVTFNEMADTIEADVNELRRQEQVRRELLANIAHDMATPLTAIQGLSEAIADDIIIDPPARQETAQRIGREVQRLRRLVADVQQMTSLESGRTILDLAPLNMHTLVDETLAVIAPECEQMNITVHNNIPVSAPPVLADSDRITQVLLNLLDNARRHTPAGGEIRVEAICAGHQLQVRVIDTGTGIAAADLPHIFERFYRADRSRTRSTGGSGLGLSIVKAIITAHSGYIWAESKPGKGTTIVFTLPLV